MQPANLNDAVRRGRANGHIFNTINVGIRNMPGYGAQVPPADRWAIVAYVRALQFSQNAPPSVVPQDATVNGLIRVASEQEPSDGTADEKTLLSGHFWSALLVCESGGHSRACC